MVTPQLGWGLVREDGRVPEGHVGPPSCTGVCGCSQRPPELLHSALALYHHLQFPSLVASRARVAELPAKSLEGLDSGHRQSAENTVAPLPLPEMSATGGPQSQPSPSMAPAPCLPQSLPLAWRVGDDLLHVDATADGREVGIGALQLLHQAGGRRQLVRGRTPAWPLAPSSPRPQGQGTQCGAGREVRRWGRLEGGWWEGGKADG